MFEALEGRVLMAAPSNDDFADARGLRGSSVVVDATTTNATFERGEGKVGLSDYRSVWFNWTAPAAGGAAIHVAHDFEPRFSAVIQVFKGKTLSTLKRVGAFFGFSEVDFVAKAGVRYHILVASPPDATGDFTLALESNLPRVSILPMDAIGAETRKGEPADTASFLLTRTGPTEHPLRVRYWASTLKGHAKARKDYRGLSEVITIPAGSKSVELVIKPLDDSKKESTERIRIRLSSGLYDYVYLDDAASVRILDND